MRYEIRPIADADMTTLGDVIATTDNIEEAKEWGANSYVFGVAIVDTVAGTCDWGHAVTALGEPAPAVEVD